jgi:hypothetical protein
VARSSTEAEYRALSHATCELQWITFLLRDLHVSCSKPPVLFCDNQSAMHIAHNPVFHERTKHLDIDCHFVRERVQSGLLRLLPIPSAEQIADFFTKSLLSKTFTFLFSKLGVLNIFAHSSLRGVLLLLMILIQWLLLHLFDPMIVVPFRILST